MSHRVRQSMRIAAIAATALLTASCGDSGSPTEPSESPAIAGHWSGTYNSASNDCDASAAANFGDNRGSVTGEIGVSEPCWNSIRFRGTFHGNTLEGEFTDFDGFSGSGRGTVSGRSLEIHLEGGELGGGRLTLRR